MASIPGATTRVVAHGMASPRHEGTERRKAEETSGRKGIEMSDFPIHSSSPSLVRRGSEDETRE